MIESKLIEHFGEIVRLGPGLSVDASTLGALFTGSGASWMYESMMAVEQAKGYGYAQYLETWRDEGILPDGRTLV